MSRLPKIASEVAYQTDYQPGERLFWFTDPGWIMGAWEFVGTLACGGTVFLYDGAPNHPGWYLNVQANPDVTVQVKDRKFPAVAHTATGEERERLWGVVNEVWPNYNVYATRTSRQIPVVVLHPAE